MDDTLPINLADARRRALVLDAETILAINEGLAKLLDEHTPLDRIHGSFTVEIVKGQFQRLQISGSQLLIDNKQRRQNKIA